MSAAKEYYEHYRTSSLGQTLIDTLDEMVNDGLLEPQLAMRIISTFDKTIAEMLSDNVKARLNFKGHLDTYRFCDEVWTFVIKDVNFKLDGGATINAPKLKIVSCNGKKEER